MSSNVPVFLKSDYLKKAAVPLWNLGSSFLDDGQEYFQLQVYSDENFIEQEKDTNDILNMNTYKCYICNINVPKPYAEEHNKSIKHIMCNKIANIALERTQSYMNTEIIRTKPKIIIEETYFCENCTAIVQYVDKETHVMSNQHQNSVENDRLLQNLVKIYEYPNTCDVANITTVKDVDSINFIDILSTNVREDNGNDVDNASIKQIDDKTEEKDTKRVSDINSEDNCNKVIAQKPLNINGKGVGKSSKNVSQKTERLINAVEKSNSDQNNTVTNNKETVKLSDNTLENKLNSTLATEVLITENTLNIDKEQRPKNAVEEDQASTSQTRKSEIVKGTLNYTENMHDLKSYFDTVSFLKPESYKYSEDFVTISAPGLGTVRVPLGNFLGYFVTGQNVICKICFEMKTLNGKKHKWSQKHVNQIMSPLKEGFLRQIDDSLRHCILCNSLHSNTETSDHIASPGHTRNLQKYAIVKYNNNISTKMAHLAVANNIQWTKNVMHCKICEIEIVKSNDSINKHLQSSDHKNSKALLLKNNNIAADEGNGFLCMVCLKKILPRHLVLHCNNPQHKKEIESKVTKECAGKSQHH